MGGGELRCCFCEHIWTLLNSYPIQASTITCAGVTAWNALDMPRNKGTALLQGNIQFYPGSTELIRGEQALAE